MTTLILIRHGQSVTNLTRTFTGQNDVPLTDLGREQAERTALYLDRFPITAIWSSDLSRARETAAPTAKRHGLTVRTDPRLREMNAGEWQGKTFEQLTADYPDTYGLMRSNVGLVKCPGGETFADVYRRVTACVDEIVHANRDGCVAVFCHGGPMRAMGCFWYGLPVERASGIPGSPNAAVSVVRYDDEWRPTVLQFCSAAHLNGEITVLPVDL